MKRRNVLRYVANGPMITCAKFGVKMFLQARDAAVNLVYNVVRISGSFLHREWQSALALPLIHSFCESNFVLISVGLAAFPSLVQCIK